MTMAVGDFANADSRLRQLLDASLVDAPDRSLPEILRDTVRAASEIVGCRYAAITVLTPAGGVEHFVPFGVEDGAIGRTPAHQSLLGTVVEEARTVRLPDTEADGRPGARSLLGVPIMLRGRSAGGVYLSEPADRTDFTEQDERTAEVIATAAANFIEKARTAAANRSRDRWLTGAAELARELVSGLHAAPLRLVAERVIEVADADVATIMQPGPDEDMFVVSAVAGKHAAQWDGLILRSTTGKTVSVMATGKPLNIEHLNQLEMPEEVRGGMDIDALILVPLTGTAPGRGVLGVGRRAGRPAFSAAEMGMATMFAGQVALALELAESLARRDQLALVEERDRIARDLHDHVIQRLFAIGLTMENAASNLTGAAGDRVRTSVDEIDETIKQIRTTIYQLTGPIVSPHASIRTQAIRLFDELEVALAFRPDLAVEGPVDFGVNEDVVDDCVAVLREALTNVARHAHATRAEVAITVTATSIQLEVRDNGRGIGPATRRSGLANLRARAERRNGTLTIRSNGEQGTWLRWSIPTEAAEDTPVPAR
jgi:signal transduction histidine kinase